MRAFVTGANGFIGSHLVPILIRRGYTVTCLLRDPSKAGRLVTMGAILVRGDVTDAQSMREAMRGADVAFHLAGWYALGNPDKARMQAINVDGARCTLELAAELDVPKIVHTSTVGVFGNTHGTIVDELYRVEKDVMASEYERTKWTAHYEVAVPLQQRGAPLVIVQPGGVTGSGDTSPHATVFEFFLKRMPVMLGAKSGLTFAHVDDIAGGHVLAAEKGRTGESYILCGPAQTYRQVFEMCETITGIPAARIWAPGWMAAGMSRAARFLELLGLQMPISAEGLGSMVDYTFWATANKAQREIGWSPRPVEEVFREVLDFLMKKRAG